MKKYLGTIALNALKICGASWIGYLVSFIPLYVMRGYQASPITQEIARSIIVCVSAMIALFSFFTWQGRTSEGKQFSVKELILVSAAPVPVWALVGWAFGGDSFFILTAVVSTCTAVTGIDPVDYKFFTPFPFALLYGFFYAIAIFLGYWYGRKHQKW